MGFFDKIKNIFKNEAKEWFDKGVEYYKLGKYEEAIECFDKVLQIDPNYELAKINKKKAEEKLKRTDEYSTEYWFNRGKALYKLGKYKKAIKCFDRVLKIDPNNANAWYNKGVALADLGKYEEAIKCFDKALQINPKFELAKNNKKRAEEKLKNIKNSSNKNEITKKRDTIIEYNTNDTKPTTEIEWVNKGYRLNYLGKYEEAIKCYDKALKINPNNAYAWYDKGRALANLGKYEEAIKCYDRALQINPNYVAAWVGKGNVLYKLNKYEEAIKCYAKALEIDPNNESAKYNKKIAVKKLKEGKILKETQTQIGKKIVKEKLKRKCYDKNSAEYGYWFNKGVEYHKLGKYEEAVKCYAKALEIDPNNAYAWNNKGEALSDLGKYEEAIRCFDKALQLYPNFAYAWFNKGYALGGLGKYEEAIKCYNKALEIDPNNAIVWFSKGVALGNLGKYREAIECFDKGLQIDPNYAKAWTVKGLALNILGKYEEAIKCFDRALELNLNDADAWYFKGNALLNLGKYEEAIKCYDRALELNPNYANAWVLKGYALSILGNHQEAIKCYDKALEIDPNDAVTWYFKGNALRHLGKYEEAIKCFDKSIQIDPNYAAAWALKGEALYNLGKYEEAIKCYDKALQINPNFELAKNNKKIAEEKLKNIKNSSNKNDKTEKRDTIIEYNTKINEFIEDLKNWCIEEYRNLPETLKRVNEEEYVYKWNKTIERIQEEAKKAIGISDELKYRIILEKLMCLRYKEKYVIEKFEKLKNMDLSDEVLEMNKIITGQGNKIIAIKLGDELIVDTLTISLVRIYNDIKNNVTYQKKFDELLKNFKLFLYYKKNESATFFNVYINNYSIVTDKRILIAFSKFKRFLDEIRTKDDSKVKQSIIYQIMEKFFKDVTKLNNSKEKSKKTENKLETILTCPKPELSLNLGIKTFKINSWKKVPITIENKGGEIKNVNIKIHGDDFDIRRLRPFSIGKNSSKTIEVYIKPKVSGEIPLDIDVEYEYNGKKYSKSFFFEVLVEEDYPKSNDDIKQPSEFTPKPLSTTSLPPELAVNYKDIELIGQGGFARVFKAVRIKDNLPVAIKIPISLDPSTGKSFIKELEIWTKLNHPNIVKVYDYNILPIPYFEMELCDESLYDYLRRKKKLPINEAAHLIFNIAEGLKYAHNKNIIHRDLKPHNILLKNGIPKISDWGLSKVIAQSTSTTKGGFTPYYAAPEQFSKKYGKVDKSTDIWQLGVIFYQLITGRLPFEGDDFVELMTSITTENPIKPTEINPSIPKEIENIILKSLNKKPEERYKDILELQRDLAKYLQLSIKEELNLSLSTKDFNRSAYYCADLVLIHLKINDGVNAYKYCGDLINYAKGEIRDDLIKLKEAIKYRVENKLPIPEEIVYNAEVVCHKIKLGFEKD